MKTLATIFAAALVSMSGTAAVAQNRPTGEERLAKLIEGRTAGDPQRCISTSIGSNKLTVIDKVGVVYDAGKTVWVARATDATSLNDRDVLVIERFGSQLCRDDVKYTVDSHDGALRTVLFLSDFVPYTRAS